MANEKWGTKRTCLTCGKKFYDMRRESIVCPSCEAPLVVKPRTRTRRQHGTPVPKPAALQPQASNIGEDSADNVGDGEKLGIAEDDDIGVDDAQDEEPVEAIPEPMETGEDEDDMGKVIKGIEKPNKLDA